MEHIITNLGFTPFTPVTNTPKRTPEEEKELDAQWKKRVEEIVKEKNLKEIKSLELGYTYYIDSTSNIFRVWSSMKEFGPLFIQVENNLRERALLLNKIISEEELK